MMTSTPKTKAPDDADRARNGTMPSDPFAGRVVTPAPAVPADEGPKLPAFPLDVLPPMLRDVVVAYARGVEAPPELAALPAMAVLSAALGPRWQVAATPGFVRPPLLWLCQVASSGSGKGPASRPVLAPLVAIDRRLREEHEDALKAWKSREAARRRKKRPPSDEDQADEEEPAPRRRYAFVTNSTIEGLLAVCQDAEGHGLLMHSDEVRTLLDGFDGYRARGSQGRGEWLSLWDGAPTRLIRKGSENAECDRPFVAVLGGVQPSILPTLALRQEDGLAPRFLWAHVAATESGLGDGVDARVSELWARAVRLAADHAVRDVQPFDAEGRALLDVGKREWSGRAIELEGAGLGLLAGFYAKATDHAVRLAALLHGLDAIEDALQEHEHDPPPLRSRGVPAATVRRALQLVAYFLAHGAHTTKIVTRPAPPEGAGTAKAAALATALRSILEPGVTETDTPEGWSIRLAGAGLVISAEEVGRRFNRLLEEPVPGMAVVRKKTKHRRTWTVTATGRHAG